MKNTRNTLMGLGLIALLLVAVGLTGCRSSGDRSMAQQWGDRQVAKGVKEELSKDLMYKYPDVYPVVHNGVVQLNGFVDTPQQRQRAAKLAVRAKGVLEVINTIALKSAPTIREAFSTNAPAPLTPTGPDGGSPGQEPKANP